MPRPYCQHCQYPTATCICASIAPVSTGLKIDILQHPSEQNAAKNTARLARLCVSSLDIWPGESPEDFTEVRASIAQSKVQPIVLYPSELAQPLTALKRRTPANTRVILLDGTWRKAYKIWQLNPWLWDFTHVKLSQQTGRYRIRKAPGAGQLSTLEALTYCIQALDPTINTTPLFDCFDAMQSHFIVR